MNLRYHLLIILVLFSQAKGQELRSLQNAIFIGNFENVKTAWGKLSEADKYFETHHGIIIMVYFQAAEHNDTSMLQWLIDNVKLDLNRETTQGDTRYIIQAAANYNRLEAVNFLLEKGANINNIPQKTYKSFIKYAKENRQYLIDHKLNEILKLLD